MNIEHTNFGNRKQYPIIDSLINLFNERSDNGDNIKKNYKYCVNVINDLNNILNGFNSVDKFYRHYVYILVKKDFNNRINKSLLDNKLRFLLKKLIHMIINNKIEVFIKR